MKRKILIIVATLVAVSGVLAAKLILAPEAVLTASNDASTRVVLVADLREAESSCGCAAIIRAARSVQGVSGVAYEEHDVRLAPEAMQKYAVRSEPTVIIASGDGTERQRFEGESRDVVKALQGALASLGPTTVR